METFTSILNQSEKNNDKYGTGIGCIGIGAVHLVRGDYEKALIFGQRSLIIQEELGNLEEVANCLGGISVVYDWSGNYDKALKYCNKATKIMEEIGDIMRVAGGYNHSGVLHYNKGAYDKALIHLERSLSIQNEHSIVAIKYETTIYLQLTYKKLGNNYDIQEVHQAIKQQKLLKEFDKDFRVALCPNNKQFARGKNVLMCY